MRDNPPVSGSGPRIAPKPGAISAYCEAHGISRDELARRMGVASSSAYRVDRGLVEPSPAFIARLMDATGQGFDDLFIVTDGTAA